MATKQTLRRPVFTEKAAANLEALIVRLSGMPDVANFKDAIAFCKAMLVYHKANEEFRTSVRTRAKSLRVIKPETKAITYQGRRQTLMAWSKELEITYTTIYERMRRGKTFAEAVAQN